MAYFMVTTAFKEQSKFLYFLLFIYLEPNAITAMCSIIHKNIESQAILKWIT
jgi:hypothetical protein